MITADELLKLFGFTEDKQLSELLGKKSQSVVSNWRKAGKVPADVEIRCRDMLKSTIINGNGNHVDIHHGTVANDPSPEYADPISQMFLKDWLKLSDVVKMRVWTLVKEELEKLK